MPSWFEVANSADAARVGIALTDGTFAPNDAGRRGALLAWLWRHAGSPAATPSTAFTDVGRGLRPAVDWAIDIGMVSASKARFHPQRAATRATSAQWLRVVAGRPDRRPPPASGRQCVALRLAAIVWQLSDPPGAKGPIATGFHDRTLRPASATTRAQAVGWLQRVDVGLA